MNSQGSDTSPPLDSRGLPWYQTVKIQFIGYDGFSNRDNSVLMEVLKTLKRMEKEPTCICSANTGVHREIPRRASQVMRGKIGKEIGGHFGPAQRSTYHKFRKAARTEGPISQEFSDWARDIAKMRNAMIHLRLDELATTGDRTKRAFVSVLKQLEEKLPAGDLSPTEPSPAITHRPLNQIPEKERLESVLEGMRWYAGWIDTLFANMSPEIKVLKIVEYEI